MAANTSTHLTCIHWAAFYTDDAESLKLLASKTTLDQVFALDYKNRTPLDIAGIKSLNNGCFSTLDYLLECAEKYFAAATAKSVKETAIEVQGVKIKSRLGDYTEKEKLYLDMLYWASYRDRTRFALRLVKFGVSPFLAHTMGENAIISGIKGGAYNTVKSIIEFNYEFRKGTGNMLSKCK